MLNHTTYGIVFGVLAVIFFIAFLFNFKAISNFSVLNTGSKVLAILIAIITLGFTFAFSWFSYQNFTYKAPKVDKLTKQLQTQIDDVKKTTKKYVQKISSQDYFNLSSEELYKFYSKAGQSDIDNLAKQSELTKDLFLRNVGRKFTAGDIFTTKFKATNGKEIDMLDKKPKVIAFVDGTEYSAKVLGLMRKHIEKNKLDVQLVMFFPVTSGTDIDTFFTKYRDQVGSQDQATIVSSDSISNMSNLNVKYITTKEYQVKNLPSYIAIDNQSVISNAGVGSLLNTDEDVAAWFNKAFVSDMKYYDRIVKSSKHGNNSPSASSNSVGESSASAPNKGEGDK